MENTEQFLFPTIEKNGEALKSNTQAASSSAAEGKKRGQTKPVNGDSFAQNSVGRVSQDPVEVSLRTLLEAGVHFGHQTSRWHPAMAQYIYTARNGVHIINLPKTLEVWEKARAVIVDIAANGGEILFVGTKKQAQAPVVEEARRCGAFYVSQRWLGGMLTNFQTIKRSIDRLRNIETTLVEEEQRLQEQKAYLESRQQAEGETVTFTSAEVAAGAMRIGPKFTKKERLMFDRERQKLLVSLGGIREMHNTPQLLFVVDIRREEIAVKEAQRLDIPVIALVDTNCNPTGVNYPIPSNDDATRAIRLFTTAVADAVLEGKATFAERRMRVDDKSESDSELSGKQVRKRSQRTSRGRAERGIEVKDSVDRIEVKDRAAVASGESSIVEKDATSSEAENT